MPTAATASSPWAPSMMVSTMLAVVAQQVLKGHGKANGKDRAIKRLVSQNRPVHPIHLACIYAKSALLIGYYGLTALVKPLREKLAAEEIAASKSRERADESQVPQGAGQICPKRRRAAFYGAHGFLARYSTWVSSNTIRLPAAFTAL